MSRVGSLPLSLTRTRLNSRSVSPLPLSSALSAETARLDFGTFGTHFCYIGTWNIRKTLPFLKVSIVLNSAGRLSLSLSLSARRSSFKIALRFQSTTRDTFFLLASLFRGTRARRTRWVLLFSRVFCSRGNFLCRPHPERRAIEKRNARAHMSSFAFIVVQQYYYYYYYLQFDLYARAFLLSPGGGIHGGVVQRATHHGFVVSVIHANSFAAAAIPKSSASVATGGD